MTVSKFSTWTFITFLLISLVLVIRLLFDFITPILMAAIIVSIFRPLHNKILRFLGNRSYMAAGLSTFLVFLCVLIPLAVFMMSLVQQASNLLAATEGLSSTSGIDDWLSSLRVYIGMLNDRLAKYHINIAEERIMNAASTLSQTMGQWLYEGLSTLAANLLNVVINFMLMVALVFVLFINAHTTKKFIMDLVPLPHAELERLNYRFKELSHAIFIGSGFICIAQGILGGFSFWAFGIAGAVFWGFVITVTALLPVVGSAIVLVPAAIYLFLMGSTTYAVAFLAFNVVQITLLETLVKPRLIGNKSNMHAALVFMSILAGIQLYGFFGLFYGPLLVTIFLSLVEIYKEHYRDYLLRH